MIEIIDYYYLLMIEIIEKLKNIAILQVKIEVQHIVNAI